MMEAQARLSTSYKVKYLIGREDESRFVREFIVKNVESAVEEPHAMYVSGVPGVGKTATVLQVNKISKILLLTAKFQKSMELVYYYIGTLLDWYIVGLLNCYFRESNLDLTNQPINY